MNKRPRVWFEISIDGTFEGRINISLYNDITPITAENFRCLCTGEKGVGQSGKNLHYKGNYIHKAITEFVLQGGDITTQDGKGGESIYGPRFKDENFKIKHDKAGLLSMANRGPNTNSSQFFITLTDCNWLDGKHTIFGELADEDSWKLVQLIEKEGSPNGELKKKIKIEDCGEYIDY